MRRISILNFTPSTWQRIADLCRGLIHQAQPSSGRIDPSPMSIGTSLIQAALAGLAELGFIVCLLLGCAKGNENEGSFRILDDSGVEVAFPGAPERVVSLVPSVTEVIFALGAQERLVGVTTFCDYPPEARAKPKVGDFSNPSLERIFGLKPDLVFATMPEQSPIIQKLRNLGIRVFCLQPESVRGILGSIEKCGQILGQTERADSLGEGLRAGLNRISRLARRNPPKKVYVEIAANPLMTATTSSFVGELVALAGGTNMAKGPKPYVLFNPERVVIEDPEVIIIAHPTASPDDVKRRVGWDKISAIREDKVYRVDPDLVLRPGPRIVDGALELILKIHPEAAAKPAD